MTVYADRLPAMIDDVRARAASLEHEWDRRALDWPMLKMQSVVVEVGGYCGRWALQIAERYHPRLFVFEPQPWAADVCRAVLGDRAQVVQAALGTVFGPVLMGKWETDGCSLVEAGDRQVVMVEIGTAFTQLYIGDPDLMLMNIEGYEYTLLPHMFDQGIYPKRLMVQFHAFADPDGDGARAIQQRMAGRYRMLWDYGVLTAWERL